MNKLEILNSMKTDVENLIWWNGFHSGLRVGCVIAIIAIFVTTFVIIKIEGWGNK